MKKITLILFISFQILFLSFSGECQSEYHCGVSAVTSLTSVIGIYKGDVGLSTLQFTATVNKTFNKKYNLNFSFSKWIMTGNGMTPPFISVNKSEYKADNIHQRINYHFIDAGTLIPILNKKYYEISVLPQLSFMWGVNNNLKFDLQPWDDIIFNYDTSIHRLGAALKLKADFKIYKNRFIAGFNSTCRFIPLDNYNYTKAYMPFDFGIHAGVNF